MCLREFAESVELLIDNNFELEDEIIHRFNLSKSKIKNYIVRFKMLLEYAKNNNDNLIGLVINKLKQYYFIKANMAEIKSLKELSTSVSAIRCDKDKIQMSRNIESPFIKYLEMIDKLEEEVKDEMELMIALKLQIRCLINTLPNEDERLILFYRYCQHNTWDEIATKLHAGRTSIIRWHDSAIKKLELPENYIKL